MNIGNRIRYYRNIRGLSTNDLATLAEVSKSTVNDIETNQGRSPSLKTIEKICNALNVPFIDLLPAEAFTLTTDEEKILYNVLDKLNDDQRVKLIAFLKSLVDEPSK
jgi:transcriptional regulator with XRE-family HTH domain